MNKNHILFFLLLGLFMGSNKMVSQNISIKTNVVSGITTSFNLGAEFALSPRWTIDATYQVNPWTFSENKKWKHWFVQPEARYWFCSKFNGHFMGLHLHGGRYNVGNIDTGIRFLGTDYSQLGNYRFQGWFAGAGIGYGYSWMLSRHWNMEAELGLGYAYTKYEKFVCTQCGEKLGDGSHHYVGPTKAALNLIYVF